jgi:hypothetical protein
MPILLDVVRATSREGGSVSPSPDRTVCGLTVKRNRRACASVPIGMVCESLHVCPEAVSRAARIHGVPIVGGLLGCSPARLSLAFLETCIEEHGALVAQAARLAACDPARRP